MLNIATISAVAVSASLVSLSGATGLTAPIGYSEPGSLIVFGLGLLAISLVVRRATGRS